VRAVGATGKFVGQTPVASSHAAHTAPPRPNSSAGEQARVVPRSFAEQELAERLADACVEIMPAAVHVPSLERLVVVIPPVLDFLAS
jgi:hypothetical protein